MQEDPVLVRFLLARGACLVSRAVGAIFHAQAVPGGTDSNEEGSAPEPAPERVGGRLERKRACGPGARTVMDQPQRSVRGSRQGRRDGGGH